MDVKPASKDSEWGIFSAAKLPCGKALQNRLVKVALYEHLSNFRGGPPNERHFALYSEWGRNEWGMVITGNIQVSKIHLSLGRDMVVPQTITEETLEPFKRLADAIKNQQDGHTGSSETLAIGQLSHCGRQSPNLLGGRFPFKPPVGPSAIRLGSSKQGDGLTKFFHWFLFQEPRPLIPSEIDNIVADFVRGAIVCYKAGLDGVQLHAAHGYLLAQFISPKSNRRVDEYSANDLFFLKRLVTQVRKAVPPDFILGIKINSADYAQCKATSSPTGDTSSKEPDERALCHIRQISSWGGVDFIEISGGDYEEPEFMRVSKAAPPRQALFAQFSAQALKVANEANPQNPPLILLTGGLRTPAHLHTALRLNHAQLLGIGRSSITCPQLPRLLQEKYSPTDSNPFVSEPNLEMKAVWPFSLLPRIPLIGAGVDVAWYTSKLHDIAYGTPERHFTPFEGLLLMWLPRQGPSIELTLVFLVTLGLFIYSLAL